jgi:4-amino-4-deoxy-L-arabinose transferase-like glycosyltransferase
VSSRSKKASRPGAGQPTETPVPEKGRLQLSKRWTWAIFTVILAIAGGLRLYRITSTPPALFLDEGADGANAVQALETGDFQVFYPEDNGREGLYINIAAVFIHFFGSNAWALRLPAVVFGLLTVAGVYALTAELISPPAGLAAAFFLATSFWHVNFSRIAFRAIGSPLFLVWALYFLLMALRRLREGRKFAVQASLAGVIYGLGFHTYIAYRVTPILVILVLVFPWVEASRSGWVRRYWTAVGLFAVGAAVVMYPLVAYLVSHPAMAIDRMNQVSAFHGRSPMRDIANNTWKTVGMLYWKGDTNWRQNYPGRPEVFWPVVLLMTFGIAVAIRRILARPPPPALLPPTLLLLWILCGAIPAVLSNDGIPHALRSILMLPPIAILAAMGAAEILSAVPSTISRSVLTVAVIGLACALTGEAAHTYFYLWAADPSLPREFDANITLAADQINSLPKERAKVVAIDGPSAAADPFFLPFVALRFLTRSVTLKQQNESNIRFYTPGTFPLPLPAGPGAGDFCSRAEAAMPQAIVVCIAL